MSNARREGPMAPITDCRQTQRTTEVAAELSVGYIYTAAMLQWAKVEVKTCSEN
jgi:hypothetical protein